MASKLILSVFFILVYSIARPQQLNADTISVKIDLKQYETVAKDSTERLIANQIAYYANQEAPKGKTVLFQKDRTNLRIKSLPMFRLYRYARDEYSCSKSIEHFIGFYEKYKFQSILLGGKSGYFTEYMIPDPEQELERVANPAHYTRIDKNKYESLISSIGGGNGTNPLYARITESGSFYFKIWGLWYVFFEVEHQSKRTYAIWLDETGTVRREPIND